MPLRAWRSQRVCVRCSVVEDPDAPLTPEQIDHFLVNGYVALPGLFPEDFNDAMKRDVDRLVDDRAAKQAAPLIASSARSARSQRNLLSKILGNLAALLFLAFSTPLAPARHARSRGLDPIRIDAVRICTSATQCPSACKHLSCSDRQRGRGRMARASAVCGRAGVGISCVRTALAWVGRCQQRLNEHAVHHHPAHGAENHPDETEVVCALRGVQRQVRLVPPAGTRRTLNGRDG